VVTAALSGHHAAEDSAADLSDPFREGAELLAGAARREAGKEEI
jgi:hypothetical protein